MAFKELADLECSTTTALGGTDKRSGKKNPTSITGYFIGSRKVESQKSKTGFAFLHIFQTEKGNVGVWGKANLDAKLAVVKPGSMTRVTFVGMVKTNKNDMYKYKVEVDADDRIDVAESAGTDSGYEDEGNEDYDAGAANDSDDTNSDDSPADEDTEETADDEVQAARATPPKSTPDIEERKAKAQALLSKHRNRQAAAANQRSTT